MFILSISDKQNKLQVHIFYQAVEANLYEIYGRKGKIKKPTVEGKTENENIAFSLTEEDIYVFLKERCFSDALIKTVFFLCKHCCVKLKTNNPQINKKDLTGFH